MIYSQVKINLAFRKKIQTGDSGFSNTSTVDAGHNPKILSVYLIVIALRLLYLIHPREEHKGCVVSMPGIKETLVPMYMQRRVQKQKTGILFQNEVALCNWFSFPIPNLCDVCEGYVVYVQSHIICDLYTHPCSL